MMAGPTCMLPRWLVYSHEKVQDDDSQVCRSVGESSNCDAKARLYLQLRCSDFAIVVTYSQFDSNICVFYVFLGFLKNTWKYLIQRPIFKPLYFYNFFLNTWKYFFFSTFEKYLYFVCHYYGFCFQDLSAFLFYRSWTSISLAFMYLWISKSLVTRSCAAGFFAKLKFKESNRGWCP